MSDDELGGELDRVLRVTLTVSGQLAERLARSRADAERNAHQATAEAQRAAERQLARQVEAGRAVYGGVREPQMWEQPNAQRRLGEALVAAEALRGADPVAPQAGRYIRAEARRRYGPDSDTWLAAAVQSYLEELNERGDAADSAPIAAADVQGEAGATQTPMAQNADIVVPGLEQGPGDASVAQKAFPIAAAEDLHRSGRARPPAARRALAGKQQRDRSRAR